MKSIRHLAGFTIHELLVALALSAVLALAGLGFLRSQLRDLSRQSSGLDAVEKARAAIGFIAREIRSAGYDPKLTAMVLPTFTGISEAGSERILLERDRDQSGAIDGGAVDPDAESVRYFYDAGTRRILRTVGGVSNSLVTNVPPGGFSLRYFDALGNEIPQTGLPAQVASVGRDLITTVILRIRVETAGVVPMTTYEMASHVAVRARILDRL